MQLVAGCNMYEMLSYIYHLAAPIFVSLKMLLLFLSVFIVLCFIFT